MAEAPENNEADKSAGICKVGYYAGMSAALAAFAYTIVQVLQVRGLLHFPTDETLIYGTSLVIVVPLLLLMLALHYRANANVKYYSHAALIFTIIYSVFVSANYVVQLATVIPLKLKGQLAASQLLEQTPHSLFWDFDAIGYIFLGFAAAAAVPGLAKNGFEKWVRLSFVFHASTTPFIAIVYFSAVYSNKLLFLGAAWGITAPLFMLMAALLLRKESRLLKRNSAG